MIAFVNALLRAVVATGVGAWYYLRAIARKVVRDDILFLASGLAFNGILTMVALLLLGAAAIGWFLNSSSAGVAQTNGILNAIFPSQPFATSIKESILNFLSDIVTYRRSIGIFGLLVLIWTATSLFDALRSALHTIYELKRTKGLLVRLVHDIGFVAVALILFVASNFSIWIFTLIEHLVVNNPALSPLLIEGLNRFVPTAIVVVLTAVMFYIVYRFMTDTKPPRTAAIISMITTTILWVVSGKLFGLYLSHVSDIGKFYGAYAFLLVLMLWIYYSCILFVFGGIVGQVYWERRKEREARRSAQHRQRHEPVAIDR